MLALCAEHGFGQYFSYGRLLHGWALMAQGQGDEGLDQMRQGLTAYQATATTWLPYFLALLAEGYGQVGAADEGLHALAEALTTVQHTGERVWEAELHRLKGELLLQARPSLQRLEATCRTPQQRRRVFIRPSTVARRQQAKALELRAAMSLARLWQQQGKRAEAHQLLAPIYGWFTEGLTPPTSKKPRPCCRHWREECRRRSPLLYTLLGPAPAVPAGMPARPCA